MGGHHTRRRTQGHRVKQFNNGSDPQSGVDGLNYLSVCVAIGIGGYYWTVGRRRRDQNGTVAVDWTDWGYETDDDPGPNCIGVPEIGRAHV